VDAWGDGLLVLAVKAAPGAPLGGAMAVLTAYGLDTTAVEAPGARWSAWWGERYAPAAPDGPPG
jgi:hypothetical protein